LGQSVSVGAQLFAMFASMGTDVDDLRVRLVSLGASTFKAKNAVAGSDGRGMIGLLESISEVALDPLLAFTCGVGRLFAHGLYGLVGPFSTVVTGMP
jgi:hypothetical protein